MYIFQREAPSAFLSASSVRVICKMRISWHVPKEKSVLEHDLVELNPSTFWTGPVRSYKEGEEHYHGGLAYTRTVASKSRHVRQGSFFSAKEINHRPSPWPKTGMLTAGVRRVQDWAADGKWHMTKQLANKVVSWASAEDTRGGGISDLSSFSVSFIFSGHNGLGTVIYFHTTVTKYWRDLESFRELQSILGGRATQSVAVRATKTFHVKRDQGAERTAGTRSQATVIRGRSPVPHLT